MTNKLNMIYDKIDTKLIKLGKTNKFSGEEEKSITSLYYEDESFEFSFKNKYVKITKIETNAYGKKFVTIKSKLYADIVEKVAKELDAVSPILSDGSFRATINDATSFSKDVGEYSFYACVSLYFPSIYKDTEKTTLQVYLKEVVVTKIIKNNLEVEFDKLSLAI